MNKPLCWAMAATLAGTVFGATAVQASDLPGDPLLGQKLSREVCSECHRVEKGVARQGKVRPPSFQELADNPTMSPLALRFVLQGSDKQQMPNLILTKDETDDVIAYIRSLRVAQ